MGKCIGCCSGGFHEQRLQLLYCVNKEAVLFGDFTLASGQKSHFFIDMKRVTLKPMLLGRIARLMYNDIHSWAVLKNHFIWRIGGLSLGAAPLTTALLGLSYLRDGIDLFEGAMIRKETKDHGTGKLIEGPPKRDGEMAIVVEDVTTTGGSSMLAVNAFRQAGYKVPLVVTVLDREVGARDLLVSEGIELIALLKVSQLDLTLRD